MDCTTWHRKKRILYRCTSLLLLVSLLLYPFSPIQTHAVWHEELVPWSTGRCSRRRYRWTTIRPFHFWGRWGLILLCRLGLTASLLWWSGWCQRHAIAWALLGLPLLDAFLCLLPRYRPGVLQSPAYLPLARGVHDSYCWALVILFGLGLWRTASLCQATGLAEAASLHDPGLFRMPGSLGCLVMGGGCVKKAEGAWARGTILEDGTWLLEMEGHFLLPWKPQDDFEERILLVLWRQIRTPQSTPRRPFLRQEWLAEWFGTYQELISRWQRYVAEGGLRKLNGEYEGWVLTQELRQAILDIWVPNFWLSAEEARERLVVAGQIAAAEEISLQSIYQAAEDSGFAEVRRQLQRILSFTADGPQWKDKVLVQRLFELNEALIARLQAGPGLTPQLLLEVEALKKAGGAPITPLTKPLPFAYRWQQALFGQWQEVEDAASRCPHCGSSRVARKENIPRTKSYRDPQTREWHPVEGYRHYCLNPSCPFGTFTDYPEDVHLYAEWTVDMIVWSVMVYMHLRTTYRRAADVVGVSHVTLWRWTMIVGEQALPVAALFGVVRSSGVVGIDEKWVLVPKNDKPEGKRQRWMYVYLAVDVYTYDLLHIDIYPYNGKDEARAFLQGLKAKGYQPKVIVTDMNQDYAEPIHTIFPQAIHHECVFHALQWAQRLIKDVYGHGYAHTRPEAVILKNQIYHIFQARSRKTVNKRYQQVMALAETYVAQEPQAQRVFDFLADHYPKLLNAVENPLAPLTNNTVELVNRRFDQHYQNMCGFDSIETARKYLGLFELTYRFTPFVKDNRPVKGRELDIRGKCPLELAGYDISRMPLARILRARLLGWPPEAVKELVPNV